MTDVNVVAKGVLHPGYAQRGGSAARNRQQTQGDGTSGPP